MSRTDKTNPFWVKLDRGDLASDEWHDHSHGTCDLPERWLDQFTGKTRCRREFRFTGIRTCCCPLCHAWDYPLPEPRRRRRERRTAKHKMRDWASEYEDAA